MRIGIDAHILGKKKGGVERYVLELCKRIPQILPQEEFFFFLDRKGIGLLPPMRNGQSVVLPTTNPLLQRSIILPYCTLKYKLDVLHVQRIAPTLSACPIIISIHDLLPLTAPQDHPGINNSIVRLLTKSSVYRAEHILTVSETVAQEITSLCDINTSKVSSVYNGVDTAYFTPHKITDNTKKYTGEYILYLGAIEERKNLAVAIKAFHKVSQQRKEVYFILTGKVRSEAYHTSLLRLIGNLHISDKVIFTDHLPDTDCLDLVRNALLFLAPSRGEGFDLPPLEAMACGTPVICSDIPVHREVLGDDALFFQHDSDKQLANSMIQLLSSNFLRNRLGQQGLKRTQRYSWETTALHIANIYQEFDKKRRAYPPE